MRFHEWYYYSGWPAGPSSNDWGGSASAPWWSSRYYHYYYCWALRTILNASHKSVCMSGSEFFFDWWPILVTLPFIIPPLYRPSGIDDWLAKTSRTAKKQTPQFFITYACHKMMMLTAHKKYFLRIKIVLLLTSRHNQHTYGVHVM